MPSLKFTVLTLTTIAMVAGCSANNSKFKDLDPSGQAAFHGTQSGYNRLSDHYVASVDGGRWDTRLMKFFYYPYGNGPKELIGITSASLFDDANFGPQNEHFAVSAGGTAILYFHEAEFGYGKTTHFTDGLYLYEHGKGSQWLRPLGDHVIDPTEIDRYLQGK
jgi:hypothetical protein